MRKKSEPTPPPAVTVESVAELLKQKTPGAAAQLRDLAEAPDKAVSKAARRALYVLKQSGIEPPPAAPAPQEEPKAPANFAHQAYFTNIAGNGNQMLLFVQDDPYGGWPRLITFLINYGTGLVALGSNKISRKDLEGALEGLRTKEAGLLGEAPVDYGRYLLNEAVARTRACHGTTPKGFLDLMERVGEPQKEFPQPLIYDYYSLDSLQNDPAVPHDPEGLFESVNFRAWLLEVQDVLPWEEKFWESVQTALALDHNQRTKLGDKVVDEATDALLGGDAFTAMRRRLEEQALVLHLAGHPEEARRTLYHAVSMDETKPPHENPFARILTLRSIHLVLALKAEAEEPQGPEAQPEPTSLIERI
jgi:hypothetical protein